MPTIAESQVSIRFFGEELDPSEVTALLGCEPSLQFRKGDLVCAERAHRRRTGGWLIVAENCKPGAVDEQLAQLFANMSQDMRVWAALATRFDVDVYCGLFMNQSNEGFALKPGTLHALAARRLEIGFDIYGPGMSAEGEAPG